MDFLSSKPLRGFVYQARNANIWMMAFLLLCIVFVIFIKKHFDLVNADRKILIPYNIATSSSQVSYTSEFSEPSDYIFLIAEADSVLYSQFTHRSVISRKNRFINRLHPNVRQVNADSIKNSAMMDEQNLVQQVATIEGNISMSKDGRVRVPVVIKKTIIGEPQPEVKAYLYFKYEANESGLPFIASFTYEEVPKFD